MKKILVVANETVVGRPLIEAVKRHAEAGDVKVHVICPQNQPRSGFVVYDEEARWAAENRLKATVARLQEAGIQADGAIMDPDPYSAVMDALAEEDYDEIIISTHPETKSGWLRRDLIQRVKQASRRPVEHVVVEHAAQEHRAREILVVANQTADTDKLFDVLKRRSEERDTNFIVVLPQGEGAAGDPYERLAHVLRHMEEAGLEAVGQVVHPDPFTAIQNAIRFYPVDEIVISTFEPERSGWLRTDLVERVKSSTGKPVEHVVVAMSEASA
ncbi:MAG TPA: universal stress protein [Vicinamibacteria bacterium]|nr:universal stress protein [Vicinamibacteria bacterium]